MKPNKCTPEKWIVPNKEIAICQFATNPGVKERHYKYHSQGVKCSTVVCDWHAADKNRIPKEWRE